MGWVWWLGWGGNEWVDDEVVVVGVEGTKRGGKRPHMQMREVGREREVLS